MSKSPLSQCRVDNVPAVIRLIFFAPTARGQWGHFYHCGPLTFSNILCQIKSQPSELRDDMLSPSKPIGNFI